MNMSPEAQEVQHEFESCKLKAYPDPKTGGKPWTCGWGCTGEDSFGNAIDESTEWTQEQADHEHAVKLAYFEDLVRQNVTVELTQGVFDCMVDIIFNVGPGTRDSAANDWHGRDGIITLRSGKPSTLLRKLNEGDFAGAKDSYDDWVSPGSNVEKGLRRRRKAFLDRFWDM